MHTRISQLNAPSSLSSNPITSTASQVDPRTRIVSNASAGNAGTVIIRSDEDIIITADGTTGQSGGVVTPGGDGSTTTTTTTTSGATSFNTLLTIGAVGAVAYFLFK